MRIKRLGTDTWLQAEEVMSVFVRLTPAGDVLPMSGDDWVTAIGEPVLSEAAPEGVRDLFEVARGALAYGFFFYPLYALGLEQVLRVMEAGLTHKCRGMGAPPSVSGYKHKIEWLVQQGVIPKSKKELWHSARKLRNIASHPEQQALVPPGLAITALTRAAEEISALYAKAR